MQVIVSGQTVEIGQALQEYVKDKIVKCVTKYFDHAINAHVVFHKHGVFFNADIVVNDGTGMHTLIRGEAQCDDVYAAFDMALVKIEKQLRRYKNRIKDHHKAKLSSLLADELVATKYIISPFGDETQDDFIMDDVTEDNPVIIAERAAKIERLTVSEAVMRMDLNALPALLFINSNSNCINLVYHRPDGNISWIDTKQMAAN